MRKSLADKRYNSLRHDGDTKTSGDHFGGTRMQAPSPLSC